MTREEAKEFLIDISYKLGNMSVEYLSEKDGEKMREAIIALEQEPKTGHWIYSKAVNTGEIRWSECSVCGNGECGCAKRMKFCPNCGARMESEET